MNNLMAQDDNQILFYNNFNIIANNKSINYY